MIPVPSATVVLQDASGHIDEPALFHTVIARHSRFANAAVERQPEKSTTHGSLYPRRARDPAAAVFAAPIDRFINLGVWHISLARASANEMFSFHVALSSLDGNDIN
jgi:hypothetical protein